ncbi:hypothetical protein [Thermoactinospora rubra]|uniref:hypothetical protein n=1 Tax=Thermoactinospora rubra TaxID=1088767 RepID=UPI001301D817|nr:hypothetical protein [Thermoactinospora rubra]
MLRRHRPLMLFTAAMVAATLITGVLYAVDPRTLDGMPLWAKPLKFAVSFALYGFVWAWLLSLPHKARRTSWWAGTALVVAGVIEFGIIALQATRHTRSHFNDDTPFDDTLFTIMGVTIVVLMIGNIVGAVTVLLARQADRVTASAIRLGLVIGTAGLLLGALMFIPWPGRPVFGDFAGAHSVGVPDGGPGLPLLGWSTTGGDLRIPHFVGMHALQLFPLLAIGLAAAARRLPALAPQEVRLRLIRIAGFAYAGLLALVTWQAMRGQPLIRPDGLTLAALGLLTVLTLGAALAVVARSQPKPETGSPSEPQTMEAV